MYRAPALLTASALFACATRDPSAHCRELGDGFLRSTAVEVRVGSRLRADGGLTDGATVSCEQVSAARTYFVTASSLVASLPASLKPPRFVIHHEPSLPTGARPLTQLEMHRPTGALLAAGDAIPRAVWLHELAHVRMRGARPGAVVARRIFDALDEGIADYYAAAILATPRLVVRDLERPPPIVADDWASIALDSFEPHRLGWKLAAALWAREPHAGPLLDDLVECMTRIADSPEGARTSVTIGVWLDSCPVRSRAAIRDVVAGWLPGELEPVASSTVP